MAKYGGITFAGKSGEKYFFHAWPLDTRFKAVGAVYFVTKRVYKNKTYRIASHESIYIGETKDLTAPFATQTELGCFSKHGADCVCILLSADEEQRLAIARDLLACHTTTCNDLREHRTRIQAEAEF